MFSDMRGAKMGADRLLRSCNTEAGNRMLNRTRCRVRITSSYSGDVFWYHMYSR